MDMAQELCEETSQICTEELFLRADIEREIFGQRDDYVRRIENELGVTILSKRCNSCFRRKKGSPPGCADAESAGRSCKTGHRH